MKWRTNVSDKVSDITKNKYDKKNQPRSRSKMLECERFCHIKTGCPTFLRKHKRGFLLLGLMMKVKKKRLVKLLLSLKNMTHVMKISQRKN